MNKTVIKLLEIEPYGGARRFQSQLMVGKDSADFIIDDDGVMKNWGSGNKGFNFYPYTEPYEIVNKTEDMRFQPLN